MEMRDTAKIQAAQQKYCSATHRSTEAIWNAQNGFTTSAKATFQIGLTFIVVQFLPNNFSRRCTSSQVKGLAPDKNHFTVWSLSKSLKCKRVPNQAAKRAKQLAAPQLLELGCVHIVDKSEMFVDEVFHKELHKNQFRFTSTAQTEQRQSKTSLIRRDQIDLFVRGGLTVAGCGQSAEKLQVVI